MPNPKTKKDLFSGMGLLEKKKAKMTEQPIGGLEKLRKNKKRRS